MAIIIYIKYTRKEQIYRYKFTFFRKDVSSMPAIEIKRIRISYQ